MKVFYLFSQYVSHLKAGREYVGSLISLGVEFAETIESADVVIIHNEPPSYPYYFEKNPILKEKFTIGCALWETDILPDIYLEALRLVDEIWTCSQFTLDIFSKYFDNVYKIPYIVPKYNIKSSYINEMESDLAHDPEAYYFYTIADSTNPRKNLFDTIESFLKVQSSTERKVFLVVKQYRKALPYLSSLPNVISIDQHLDDLAIQALHAVCDCYVSSHCAEAWGLSISDAMSFGNLVIATGYSGNMEYMNHENSIPVKYVLKNIKEEDLTFQPQLLNCKMSWAYIDVDDLTDKMTNCHGASDHSEKRENARGIADRYSPMRIANIMKIRLDEAFRS